MQRNQINFGGKQKKSMSTFTPLVIPLNSIYPAEIAEKARTFEFGGGKGHTFVNHIRNITSSNTSRHETGAAA